MRFLKRINPEGRFQEIIHHLVFTRNGLDKFGVRFNIRNQPVGIFTHFEEIRFFFRRLDLASAVRAFAVHELGLRPKRLTGRTIQSLIGTFIDVSLIIKAFEYFLYLTLMRLIGRSDKFIIGRIQIVADFTNLSGHMIHEHFRCNACLFCLQFDLLSMLVGPGLKKTS